jgi:site-specific DNA-methyltransferase (adenine-specific)
MNKELDMLELDKIYNMDCIEGMKQIDDNSIDCIIIDPPYFLPAQHYATRKQFSRNFSDLGILEHFFKDIFKEYQRMLKQTGYIYIFCDGQSYPLFYYHLYPFCKSVRPLIWDKKVSINGYCWRHQHELIIFAEMPKVKPIPSGDGDILRYNAVKVDNRKHPAEKPIELLIKIINKTTKENELVLDTFAGCGVTLIACKRLNRHYLGFELSKEYYDIAIDKIRKDTNL